MMAGASKGRAGNDERTLSGSSGEECVPGGHGHHSSVNIVSVIADEAVGVLGVCVGSPIGDIRKGILDRIRRVQDAVTGVLSLP